MRHGKGVEKQDKILGKHAVPRQGACKLGMCWQAAVRLALPVQQLLQGLPLVSASKMQISAAPGCGAVYLCKTH